MADIQRPNAADGSSLFAAIVKTVALITALVWALSVLSFIAAVGGTGGYTLGLLFVLVLGTPVFFIFVLPALLFSFIGGEPGAKAGARFLVAGALVVGAVFSVPMLLRAMS